MSAVPVLALYSGVVRAGSIQNDGITFTGQVRSVATAEALPGVVITARNSNDVTVSDQYGTFQIVAQDASDIVVFTLSGFATREKPVSEIDTPFQLNLTPLHGFQTESVNIGYGRLEPTQLASSVTVLRNRELYRANGNNLEEYLAGTVPGLHVLRNSGQPGGAFSMRMRGIHNLSGSSEPLLVIDGIPFSGQSNDLTSALSILNPLDIASVEVLRDAAAASIYGARASNGVILITTRRGRSGQLDVDYQGSFGFQQLPSRIEMMSQEQYSRYAEARVQSLPDGQQSLPGSVVSPSGNTNWQNEFYGFTPMHRHNISLAGGSAETRYYMSAGYLGQDGMARGSDLQRYSLRINFDNNPRPWLLLGTSLYTSQTESNLSAVSNDIVTDVLRMPPGVAVGSEINGWGGAGELDRAANPVALASLLDNDRKATLLTANIFGRVRFSDALDWRTEYSFIRNFQETRRFIPTYVIGPHINTVNEGSIDNARSTLWAARSFVNYGSTVTPWVELHATAGSEIQVFDYEGLAGSRQNFPGNRVRDLSVGDAATATNESISGSNSLLSFFGRVNTVIDNRYILGASLRGDASSRFGSNNRWGLFPSASAAWIITEEPFFQWDPLNRLVLRASYGVTGNEQIGDYTHSSLLQVVPGRWGRGIMFASLPNQSLKWESTRSFTAGLDADLLQDRIRVQLEVYTSTSEDLVFRKSMPLYAGVSGTNPIALPFENIGEMENQGWDVKLHTVNIQGSVSWQTDIYLSRYRNEVLKVGNLDPYIDRYLPDGELITRTAVGQPVGAFFGYVTDGIFQDADEVLSHAQQSSAIHPHEGTWVGDIRFKDLNGDGVIDERDRTWIGDPHPDLIYSMVNTVYYRGFDFSLMLGGTIGNDVFNEVRRQREDPSAWGGLMRSVSEHAVLEGGNPDNPTDINGVRLANPGTDIPRITADDPNGNQRVSDRFIEDGSHLRIQNVTVGYNLASAVERFFSVRTFRAYGSIDNLLTITGYSGYDPAVGSYFQDALMTGVDAGRYPVPRIFRLGLSLGL